MTVIDEPLFQIVGDPESPEGARIQVTPAHLAIAQNDCQLTIGWVRIARERCTVADGEGLLPELRGAADDIGALTLEHYQNWTQSRS